MAAMFVVDDDDDDELDQWSSTFAQLRSLCCSCQTEKAEIF